LKEVSEFQIHESLYEAAVGRKAYQNSRVARTQGSRNRCTVF